MTLETITTLINSFNNTAIENVEDMGWGFQVEFDATQFAAQGIQNEIEQKIRIIKNYDENYNVTELYAIVVNK